MKKLLAKLSKKQKLVLLVDILAVVLTLVASLIANGVREGLKNHKIHDLESRNSQYSVSVDKAQNGEITLTCETTEDNKTCKSMDVSGTYRQGSENFALESTVSNLTTSNEQFKFTVDAKAYRSDVKIDDQTITLSFKDDTNRMFYKYTLLVHINLSDASKKKLKEIEDKEAAEAAARAAESKARADAESRISKLKSCSIPTAQWTDEEAAKYSSEYIACVNREREQAKQDWNKTAPTELETLSVCRQQLEATYPYGTKIHNVAGVIANNVESADTRFYKVQVDITNAFGAKRKTVMECRVTKTANVVRVVYFNVP